MDRRKLPHADAVFWIKLYKPILSLFQMLISL